MSVAVLNVGNVERAGMLLDVLDNSDSTDIVASNGDDLGTVFVLDQSFDFAGLQVQL